MAEITPRQRVILTTLIERYIATGEPVGSGTIAGSLSPATIRNEMVALADAGYLEQPHTSAGRIPTAAAFRLFVSTLNSPIQQHTRDDIDARFHGVAGTQAVLERTSHVLATLSSGVGVAIASVPGGDQLEHVHFSRLAPQRILAVVVTRGGTVRDRVLALDRDLTPVELETAANFLNENFRGWEIERVRTELAHRVETERREYHRLLSAVQQLWQGAVPPTLAQSIYIEGVANLVTSQPADRDRLREILAALETKQKLIDLLNAYIDTRQESVRVVFDLEEQAPEMAGLVLIAAPARLAGEQHGTVAVLGTRRMPYEQTLNAVAYLAKILGDIQERQSLGLR